MAAQAIPKEPNAQLPSGLRPLDVAAKANDAGSVAALLSAGANPSLRNKNGATALHTAAAYGALESLKLLLGSGLCTESTLNALTPNGFTALDLARAHKKGECAKVLHDVGALTAEAARSRPVSSATIAAPLSVPQKTQPATTTSEDPNVMLDTGFHMLDYAARANQADRVAALLDAGADPSLRNKNNSTSLHIAAGHGSLESLKLLIKTPKGRAALNAIGPNGDTPLGYARRNRRQECVDYLLSVGGIDGPNRRLTLISSHPLAATERAPLKIVRQMSAPTVAPAFRGNVGCPEELLGIDLFLSFDSEGVAVFFKSEPQDARENLFIMDGEIESIKRDTIESMVPILPAALRDPAITKFPAWQIEEIVMNFGRAPELRLFDGKLIALAESQVDRAMLDEGFLLLRKAVGLPAPQPGCDLASGLFTSDNRVSIPNTLHRVSCVRFHTGDVIGLVYRVGKQLPGVVSIIRDVLIQCSSTDPGKPPKSLLILGRSGSGKTTLLRETSRHLSDELEQRVVIVDTSAQIAGAGLLSHPSVGNCRRLFVPERSKQHEVMTEAVENHSPNVVVIDEIDDSKEIDVARTISRSGVAVVGGARGSDLRSLLKDPVCRQLIGCVGARPQSTEQKMQLQRIEMPCFDMVIELRDHNDFLVHPSTADIVDSMLQNKPFIQQRRWFDKESGIMRARFTRVDHTEQCAT